MHERRRLEKLQQSLESIGCDALLLQDAVSLYYLTGLHFSAGQLLVHRHGAHLILDGRYAEGAKERSFYPVILSEDHALKGLLESAGYQAVTRLGFCEESSYGDYLNLQKAIAQVSRSIEIKPLRNPLFVQRMIKDPEELRRLRLAGKLGAEGFDYVCSLLREGVTEHELAADLEIFWLRHQGSKVAFAPIIAFEPSSSEPHYTPRNVPLRKGQSVLIDIGVKVEGYHSDMTRTVFFGKPTPKIQEIYDIVRKAQKAALKLCRPGTTVGELDCAARDLIAVAGYGEAFSHSLGHGIGLEIHEIPRIRNKTPDKDTVLVPHMVITIEPGIYLPGVGGVRIEDTVAISEDGYEDLTQRSKEIHILN